MDQELIDFLEQRFEKSDRQTQSLIGEVRAENRQMIEEVRTENRQTRVLVEEMGGQIQLIAEGFAGQQQLLDRFREEVAEEFRETKALVRLSYAELEHRIKGLEVRMTSLDDRLSALESAA